MRRAFLRTVGLFGVLGLFLHQPLAAQDTFELEVYPYATAHRGEWGLEAYVNHLSRGTRAFDGSVAPTDDQWRFAAQVTRGITDHWEIAAYLLGAQVPGYGLEYAGWRARTRVRAPEGWHLPVSLGFAAEFETARPLFSESARTVEFTPILERRFGAIQVILDPTIERHLAGPEKGEWEFEPRARLAVPVGSVTLGVEYHGGWGEIGNFKAGSRQVHQFYPTADFELPGEVELHLGVGFGATTSGDRLVFKTRFEMPLGGEK
jgi:hypothetical protein